MVKMSATLPSIPKGRNEDAKLRRTREVVSSLERYLSVTQFGITLASLGLVGILAANAAKSPGGKDKADLFERVARFAERTARHAMVPRVDIFSFAVVTTGADAIKQLRTHQFSRVPLTKERSVDEIVGYLY